MATIGTAFFSYGQATSARAGFAGVAVPQRGAPTTPAHLIGFAASYGDAFACSGPDRPIRQAVRSHLDCCDALERQAAAAMQALHKEEMPTAARWFGRMQDLVASQASLRPIALTPAWRQIWGETQAAWAQVAGVADLFGIVRSNPLRSILTHVIERDHICIVDVMTIPYRTGSTRKDLADRVLRKLAASTDITPVEGGLALVALPAAARRQDPAWSTGVKILDGVPFSLPLHLDESPYARALFALLNWTYTEGGREGEGLIRFHDPDLTPESAQDFAEYYANAVGDVQ